MIFVTDAEGLVTHLGRPWTRLTGQTLADARSFGWTRVVHPEDRAIVRDLVLDAIRTKSGFIVRYRLRSTEGGYRWVLAGAMPSFGPPGRTFLGFLGSLILLEDPPEDASGAVGALRPPELGWEDGSAVERAADYLLAAHSLIARAGRPGTLLAIEDALRCLGEDLAGEAMAGSGGGSGGSGDLH